MSIESETFSNYSVRQDRLLEIRDSIRSSYARV